MNINAQAEVVELVAKAPKWTGRDIDPGVTAYRGRLNKVIEDQEGNYPSMFSKFSDKSGYEGDVESLKRDYFLLSRLKDSGVTPQPIALKPTPDDSEVHLLMQKVPGKTLRQVEDDKQDVKGKFGGVVLSVADSLRQVHDRGVYVQDVNGGTFVIEGLDEEGRNLKTYVVDFEYGASREDLLDPTQHDRIKEWCDPNMDVGILLLEQAGKTTNDPITMRKIEQHKAAMVVLESFLGNESHWEVSYEEMNVHDRARYDIQYRALGKEMVRTYHQELKARYKQMVERDGPLEGEDEDTYIANQLRRRMQNQRNAAMVNVTLPYLLKNQGIEVDAKTLTYLQDVTSPFMGERPIAPGVYGE